MKKILLIVILLAASLISPKKVNAEFFTDGIMTNGQLKTDCKNTAYACVTCEYSYQQENSKGKLKEVYHQRINVFSDSKGDIYVFDIEPVNIIYDSKEYRVITYLHDEETFYTSDKKKLQCPSNLYLYQLEGSNWALFSQNGPDNEQDLYNEANEENEVLTYIKGERVNIKEEYNPTNQNYILSSYKDEAETFDCRVPTYSTLSTNCTYGDVIVTFDYSGIMGTKATHTEYGLTFPKDSGTRDTIDEIKTDLSNNTCPTGLFYSCGFGGLDCYLHKGEYSSDTSALPLCDNFGVENAGKVTCRIDSITVDKSSTLEHAIVDIDIPTKTITGYEWVNANYSDYTIVDTDVSNFVTDYAYFEDAVTQGCPTDVRLVCDPNTKTCHLTTEFQYRDRVTNLYPIDTSGSGLEVFISSITGLCVDYLGHASVKGTLANTIDKIFTIIKVAAIVLFVGFTMKEFLGVITSAKSELQPVLMTSVKRAVILILILLIPTIIDMVFGLFGFTDVLCGIK